jgi:sugar lactone lactonase YvrE
MGASKGEPSGVAVRCSNEQSQLGEGIRWDARRSELLAVDIVAGRVYRGRVGDDGAVERVRVYQLPVTVGMIAPVQGDDGWLLGAGRGFVYLALDGSHRSIADVAPAGTRMNDGACDRQGRFWAGTLADDHRQGGGAPYQLDANGRTEVMLEGLMISNGIGWSPDGRTMYVIDSGPRVIYAFAFDGTRGTLADQRVLVTVPDDVGAPDGMTVDAAGDLWVAIYEGGCVHRYTPHGRPEHLLRLRRTRSAPALRHNGNRELDRRATPRRTGRRPPLPPRYQCHRPTSRTVPPRSHMVVGLARAIDPVTVGSHARACSASIPQPPPTALTRDAGRHRPTGIPPPRCGPATVTATDPCRVTRSPSERPEPCRFASRRTRQSLLRV